MFDFLHFHEKEHGVSGPSGHFTFCGRPQIIVELAKQRSTHQRICHREVDMLVYVDRRGKNSE